MRKLTERQKAYLLEALRRYTRFHNGEELIKAWTGLGSYTQYKSVVDAGLMTRVHAPNPGYMVWWKLTDKGAAIVQRWLDAGITYKEVESLEGLGGTL